MADIFQAFHAPGKKSNFSRVLPN